MHIGEVIRENRKRKNMTQEEMGSRLGVTAPAVNKWENGNSLPDILLLAPIARLLDINIDSLLDYHVKPTNKEINVLIQEVHEKLKSEPYGEVFQWAKCIINQYPNCEELIWQIAMVLDTGRFSKEIPQAEEYDCQINDYYVRALNSRDENIRTGAADSLFGFYLSKEQYERAEEYLSYFSLQNPERKRKQAVIYSKTNRKHEAYKAYEELLFSGYQMMSMVFSFMYLLAMGEGNKEKARALIEKQRETAKTFEMGEYYEVSCALDFVTSEKDIDATIETMEKMIANLTSICGFMNSPLYEHMEFQELKGEFIDDLKKNLLTCFRDEETYGYMKECEGWKRLVQ